MAMNSIISLICAAYETYIGKFGMEKVALLLNRGAEINAKESYKGQNALMWAAAERHADVVKLGFVLCLDMELERELDLEGELP